MQLKYLNGTDYANIYGIIENGATVGTIEIKIAGREAGKKFFKSWTGKYNKRDIRRFYKELRSQAGSN